MHSVPNIKLRFLCFLWQRAVYHVKHSFFLYIFFVKVHVQVFFFINLFLFLFVFSFSFSASRPLSSLFSLRSYKVLRKNKNLNGQNPIIEWCIHNNKTCISYYIILYIIILYYTILYYIILYYIILYYIIYIYIFIYLYIYIYIYYRLLQ